MSTPTPARFPLLPLAPPPTARGSAPGPTEIVDRAGLLAALRTAIGGASAAPVALLRVDVRPAVGCGPHEDAVATVGRRVRDAMRWSDTVARLGRTTYGVVLHDLEQAEARAIASRLAALLDDVACTAPGGASTSVRHLHHRLVPDVDARGLLSLLEAHARARSSPGLSARIEHLRRAGTTGAMCDRSCA